jgi:segregation and condensation protein B
MDENEVIHPVETPETGGEHAPASEGSAPAPEEFLEDGAQTPSDPDAALKAILEAIVYVTDEPLSTQQIAMALGQPQSEIERILKVLMEEYSAPHHGVMIREVAGGYKLTTKPEHHEAVRNFVKNLKPPLKLSLAALETLAVIAYKQPITAPEVMEIRGVQGAGVLKTLLDRKLITTAGRKNVVGRPILYKTTKEFLVQFGLKDLSELPTLKEFEELRRMALTDEPAEDAPPADNGPKNEATAAGEASEFAEES